MRPVEDNGRQAMMGLFTALPGTGVATIAALPPYSQSLGHKAPAL